jgi:DNA-binding response OmpR family regulator
MRGFSRLMGLMAARRILVVEDDPAIQRGIVDALRFAGYKPCAASTFAEAVKQVSEASFDLLLLDLVLPGGSGLEVMARARKSQPTVPVIAVTALGTENDRVGGLTQGADDYVVKPFSLKELLARIDAVIRRSAERPSDVALLAVPGAEVDLARREVRYENGGRTELSQKECELLGYLARNPGRAISRDELLLRVWRLEPSRVSTRTIDMTVARLREKLGSEGEGVVLTVRGKGYMLALDVKR